MIELRWLESTSKISRTRALQYRTMTNLEELGMYEAIWSEWKNVPTVTARKMTAIPDQQITPSR